MSAPRARERKRDDERVVGEEERQLMGFFMGIVQGAHGEVDRRKASMRKKRERKDHTGPVDELHVFLFFLFWLLLVIYTANQRLTCCAVNFALLMASHASTPMEKHAF